MPDDGNYSEEPVLVERMGHIAVITINRPDVLNAINRETAELLVEAFDALDADPEVYVGVLTGMGRAFSTGMDLKSYAPGHTPIVQGRGFGGLTERPPVKPLIAAVEGYALAGGFEMVLACDLIVASEEAQFGLPEVKRGLMAAAGGCLRLPQRVPYHVAMRLLLTGERVGAPQAAQWGLVSELVAPGRARAAAIALAEVVAGNGPLAVQASKRVASQAAYPSSVDGYEAQGELARRVHVSSDAREGVEAFREKREARWTGA